MCRLLVLGYPGRFSTHLLLGTYILPDCDHLHRLTPICSTLSAGEIIPGLSAVPDNGQSGTDADWKKWITAASPKGFAAVSHPIGTAAMMKRSLGGGSSFSISELSISNRSFVSDL